MAKWTKEMIRLSEKREKLQKQMNELDIEFEAKCTHPEWSTGISFHDCLVCGASDGVSEEYRQECWEELKAKRAKEKELIKDPQSEALRLRPDQEPK